MSDVPIFPGDPRTRVPGGGQLRPAPPATLVQPPELDRIRSAHAARDWPAIRQGIDSLASADDRFVACSAVCRSGDEEFYTWVLSAAPEDPLAMTLLGHTLLTTGWDIRGGGRGSTVGRDRATQFSAYLRRADAVLLEAVARQPQRAEAWAARVTLARGLELSPLEARRRYLQAQRGAPHLLAAQTSLLQKLLPKWAGSWEAAEDFARGCAAQAPPGAPNVVLIAELHLERMLELSGQARRAYFAEPRVRAEILEAARRGPLAPDFRPGWQAKAVYNAFAMALSLVEEHAAAAVCFTALNGQLSDFPWSYLGEPMEWFTYHRDRALRGARA